MNRIEQTYIIDASPEEVWRALTDSELIPEWSGAPARFVAEPEADYSLWGGDIVGRVLEVIPAQRLVQTWQPTDWTVSDSVVSFLLSPSDGGTRVDLVHENVQDWDYNDTNEGWDIYYLGAIKRLLEGAKSEKSSAKDKPVPSAKEAAGKKRAAKNSAGRKAKATSARKTSRASAKRGSAKIAASKPSTARKSTSRKKSRR